MKLEAIDNPNERIYIVWENTFVRVKKFEEEINEFIKNDNRDLIIDLKNINKLDSMSLATIIRIKNRLNEDGRDIRLINISEDVLMVIELAGLESLI